MTTRQNPKAPDLTVIQRATLAEIKAIPLGSQVVTIDDDSISLGPWSEEASGHFIEQMEAAISHADLSEDDEPEGIQFALDVVYKAPAPTPEGLASAEEIARRVLSAELSPSLTLAEVKELLVVAANLAREDLVQNPF